ncbi:hypothetical protein Salat_2761200, partial [Sesamum alatum]
ETIFFSHSNTLPLPPSIAPLKPVPAAAKHHYSQTRSRHRQESLLSNPSPPPPRVVTLCSQTRHRRRQASLLSIKPAAASQFLYANYSVDTLNKILKLLNLTPLFQESPSFSLPFKYNFSAPF